MTQTKDSQRDQPTATTTTAAATTPLETMTTKKRIWNILNAIATIVANMTLLLVTTIAKIPFMLANTIAKIPFLLATIIVKISFLLANMFANIPFLLATALEYFISDCFQIIKATVLYGPFLMGLFQMCQLIGKTTGPYFFYESSRFQVEHIASAAYGILCTLAHLIVYSEKSSPSLRIAGKALLCYFSYIMVQIDAFIHVDLLNDIDFLRLTLTFNIIGIIFLFMDIYGTKRSRSNTDKIQIQLDSIKVTIPLYPF